MSSSTISTVNKYVLSKTGPVIPPTYSLIQSNVTLPTSYTNLTTQMNGINIEDRHVIFTPTGSGSWRNQPHEFLCSSYLRLQDNIYNMADMFDAENGVLTFWSAMQNPTIYNYPNYLDGVDMGKFSQRSYNTSGVYIGGGTVNGINNFFTTTYNSGSANGEFIQFKFPVKVLLKSCSFTCRSGQPLQGPKDVIFLGSDDGATWFLIQSITYDTYTNSVLQTKSITTTETYFYIRAVIVTTRTQGAQIGECQMTFDAYDIV
jgi:hypothetical protein